MRIIIPSYGRADKQTTLSYFTQEFREKYVSFLVYPEEAPEYEKHGINVIVCARRGIAHKRQFVLDNFDKVIMLDDDLSFAVRRDDDPTKFLPASGPEVQAAMFRMWNILCDLRYAHVGMAGREGGNRNTEKYIENSRAMRVHAWDCKQIRELDIRADDVEFMFDFHVTLSLLERGYENVLINYLVHDQKGSNSAGGCSRYRTKEKLAAAAHRLKDLHPDYVSVVTRETKTAWGGGERTDVKVSWKRALAGATLLDKGAREHTDTEGTGAAEAVE